MDGSVAELEKAELEKMLKETTEEIRKVGTTLEQHRVRMDRYEKESGHDSGELKDMEGRIATDLSARFIPLSDGQTILAQMDAIEVRMATLIESHAEDGIKHSAHRKAVKDFLGHGAVMDEASKETREFFGSKEYHTLTMGTATGGGVFVDPETEAGILKNYVDIDNVRSVARITSISTGDGLKKFKRTGTPTAYKDTELGTGTSSQAAYAELLIPVHPMTALTPVSSDLLDDFPAIEQEVNMDAGEAFSYREGSWFISGNGAGEPYGIVTSAGDDDEKYPAFVAGQDSATWLIEGDDFASMFTTLKSPYRANATWMFNSNSLFTILTLKTTTSGNYLWSPGLTQGIPNIIYGRPFIICESIADDGTSANLPVYLGDFRQGYQIVDRSGIQLQRDPYTSWPTVIFKWRKRIGGQVIKPEAIKILRPAT